MVFISTVMMYSCGSNNPKSDHTVELLKSAVFDESRALRERVAAAADMVLGVKGGAVVKQAISQVQVKPIALFRQYLI